MAEHIEERVTEADDAADQREYVALMWSLSQTLDGVDVWNVVLALTYHLGNVLARDYCDEHRAGARLEVASLIDRAMTEALQDEAQAEREEAGAVH
jgi:hypothetical protein